MTGAPARIVICGGGRTGAALARLLARQSGFAPLLVESSRRRVKALRAEGLDVHEGDCACHDTMKAPLAGANALVAAVGSALVPRLAELARGAACHFVDFSENAATRERVARIAEGARSCFASGCGLAPGFVGALADDVILASGSEDEVTVFVGVLPEERTNRLGYADLWGVNGLIDEYRHDCLALEDGRLVAIAPLTREERLSIRGRDFEAFTTSGSLDSLVSGRAGRLRGLVFKTLRYPGHLDYMRFLIDDLKLGERRYLLRNLLLNGLPPAARELVLIVIERSRDGRRERPVVRVVASTDEGSAVARMSAAHAACVLDLMQTGVLRSGALAASSGVPLGALRRSRFFSELNPGAPQGHEATQAEA